MNRITDYIGDPQDLLAALQKSKDLEPLTPIPPLSPLEPRARFVPDCPRCEATRHEALVVCCVCWLGMLVVAAAALWRG